MHKLKSTRRGAVAVEFAFVVPMLLAVVLGLIELTRAYDAQYLLQTAAREGVKDTRGLANRLADDFFTTE